MTQFTPTRARSAQDLREQGDLVRPLRPSEAEKILPDKKPDWFRVRPPSGPTYLKVKDVLTRRKLSTVCQAARCPNLSECWAGGTATFMLGGDICTRACRFCAIKTSRRPPSLDPQEPAHLADSVRELKLKYVVITMVDRDDLPDGGAGHFAASVQAMKAAHPEVIAEALVSDFQGDPSAIETVVDSRLDVYAHNIETVRRLQYRVRDPRAGYEQSLRTLVHAKEYAARLGHSVLTKSSIMLGLGETLEELREAFADLRTAQVDVLTLGQYLRPSLKHLPVEKFYSPDEFKILERTALDCGFLYVAAGPMVRSSYKAGEFYMQGIINKRRSENGIQTS